MKTRIQRSSALAFGLWWIFLATRAVVADSGTPPFSEAPVDCIGPGPGYQLVHVHVQSPEELAALLRLSENNRDIELWTDRPEIGPIQVRVPIDASHSLEAIGLQYSIVVADLQSKYDEMFTQQGGDFFDSLRTYEEHASFMVALARKHPDRAQVISLGTSFLGRPLLALRITHGSARKPGIMIHGAQHGNEVHGAVVVAHFARHLLESGTDRPEISELINLLDFYLLPIMNPDGYQAGTRYNARGVDLNRNWSGPSAGQRFSEPETAAMRDFFADHPSIRVHLDLHGYTDDILWPWGHSRIPCPDHLTFRMLADRMNNEFQRGGGPDFRERGPISTTLYSVVGGSIDYTYDAYGILAFVFELTGYGGPKNLQAWAQHMTQGLSWLSIWTRDCGETDRGGLHDCNENGVLDSCESNSDLDNLIDGCDDDIDGDGYLNSADSCPFAPTIGPPRLGGWPRADFDSNCIINNSDYHRIGDCLPFGGPGVLHPIRLCRNIDYDLDSDVDLQDIGVFFNQFE